MEIASVHHVAEKRPYLYLDLGFYAACNLKCTYCRPEVVKDDRSFQINDLIAQIEAFQKSFRAGVAKLSGYGEITMWRDFKPALAYLADRFPAVQVISNGTFSDRTRRSILEYGNVFPNITIDGHHVEMNALRVQGNESWHDRMLDNVAVFVREGRPIEINCVLHEKNADNFAAYCEHLERIDAGRGLLMIFPFPVKSFDRAPEAADPLRKGLSRMAERVPEIWQRYGQILPAWPYGEELQEILGSGSRVGDCHVHWANLGSGSRSERLHCANYGESLSYGSMHVALTTHVAEIARQEDAHLALGHVGPNCKNCYNHFHIINHYLEGKISLGELRRVPSLRADAVAAIAADLKAQFERDRRSPLTEITPA